MVVPPKWMVYDGLIENAIKMDDLGYPYFRKPPYRWCIHMVQ